MLKTFRDLSISDTYSSDECDILEEFYNPVLSLAVKYDRITGYFSPKVLAAAARGFAYAIKNNIEIRLITSVELDKSLVETINKEFGIADFENLIDWNISEIQDAITEDYLSVLAFLLKRGLLEIRVALITDDAGIFHQKVGIATDEEGNSLSFSGSNNETVYGWTRNIEEFKVFRDWTLRSATYFASDKKNFDKIWNNESKKAKVVPISEVVQDRIVCLAEKDEDINITIERIKRGIKPEQKRKRELRPYQQEAINSWFKYDCNSIFAMATGTGKTFTAMNAIKRFKEERGYLHCVIAVPLKTLTVQWQDELNGFFPDCRTINTSTQADWRGELQAMATLAGFGVDKDFVVITTYSSIRKVAELLVREDNILLADEVHNMITDRKLEAAADRHFKYRLGLSATPTRIWKKEDSKDLIRIFGNNSYEFGIDEALHEGYLVPFSYYPRIVRLDANEYADYVEMSRKINSLRKKLGDISISSKPKTEEEKEIKEVLKNLYRMRAYVKKNANEKIALLIKELQELKDKDELYHALIYVDNEAMLGALQKALLETNIITRKYIGETPLPERLEIIESLNEKRINAIIAIRCLDEGVDIPSARRSFILSNSTEPREYTQRLGRVLRLDKTSGKKMAYVDDYFVFPPQLSGFVDDDERNIARCLIKNEFRRARFFLERASNSDDVMNDLLLKIDEYGFQFEESEFEDKDIEEDEYE